MSITTNELQADPGESLREPRRAEGPSTARGFVVSGPPLPSQIGALVERIEPPPLRALVSPVFNDLARLLGYMGLVESGLAGDDSLQKTGIIFRLVHEKTLALLRQLEASASSAAEFDEGVRGALDGMGFAVGHELRRVFSEEVPKLKDSRHPLLTRAELVRAHGLLHNCFQQSIITLAQVFDASLDGSQLFEDYRLRVQQSLVLYGELLSLLQKVRDARGSAGVLPKHSLATHLKHFREETMHLLMYRDWAEFEGFVGEVEQTYDEPRDFGPVLHKFASYLGTLLRHVGMRDVLRNRPKQGATGGGRPAA
jgi:hypothetical protein